MAGGPSSAPPPPPMMPPPPPPPMPPGGWAPPKPTSGKAIASLVCGLAGPVAAFLCAPLGIAVLVGLVFGILAIAETGKEGRRAGRGMAIAGTSLSALGIIATIAIFVGFIAMFKHGKEVGEQAQQEMVAQDQTLLLTRLRDYCNANDKSLGPGGPVLANTRTSQASSTAPAGNQPVSSRLTVTGALQLSHLIGEHELKLSNRGGGRTASWELTVTGQLTATLRAYGWDGKVIREIEVTDASTGRFVQTVP